MRSYLWIAAFASALYCTRAAAQIPDVNVDVPNGSGVEGQLESGAEFNVEPNRSDVDANLDADVNVRPPADVDVQRADTQREVGAETEADVYIQGRERGDVRDRGDRDRDHVDRRGDQWRYRYHNGQWWYWLPSERWVYWNNNGWQAYAPNRGYAQGRYYAPRRDYDGRRYGYYRGYNQPYYDGYYGPYGPRQGYYNRGYYNRGYYGRPGVGIGPGGIRFNF